jgi:IS66 C-terminal element
MQHFCALKQIQGLYKQFPTPEKSFGIEPLAKSADAAEFRAADDSKKECADAATEGMMEVLKQLNVSPQTAGQRAAVILSLWATAKANSHCPHAWLTDILTRLPTTLDRDIGDLLPHRWVPREGELGGRLRSIREKLDCTDVFAAGEISGFMSG